MADKDQSRAPSNELDMDAYHSEGIDPGEHKVFNITPTIHSFNERFQGESPVSAGPGLEGYDPDKMPDWWTKVLKPNTQWPGEGLNYEPEPMPGNSTFNTITKDAFFQPISDKGPKPPLSIPELDIPLVHKPSINKDVFNPTVGRPPAKLSESLSNVEKGIKEGLDAGKSTYEIANEIGMSQSGLRHYMNKRGWKSQYSQVGGENALSAYTKDQDKQLLSLQNQGMSFSQIAKETGLTRGKVAGRLSRLNYAKMLEGDLKPPF